MDEHTRPKAAGDSEPNHQGGRGMTDTENIAWIIDRMATMVEQMGKMQEDLSWITGQLMTAQNKKEAGDE